MDNIIIRVFNPEHVVVIPLDQPDPAMPNSIKGIGCAHCEKIYRRNAHLLVDHLEDHGFKLKEILPWVK